MYQLKQIKASKLKKVQTNEDQLKLRLILWILNQCQMTKHIEFFTQVLKGCIKFLKA